MFAARRQRLARPHFRLPLTARRLVPDGEREALELTGMIQAITGTLIPHRSAAPAEGGATAAHPIQ